MNDSYDHPGVTPGIAAQAVAAVLSAMWPRLTGNLPNPSKVWRHWYTERNGDRVRARVVLIAGQAATPPAFLDAVPEVLTAEGFTVGKTQRVAERIALVEGSNGGYDIEVVSGGDSIFVVLHSQPITVTAELGRRLRQAPAEFVPWFPQRGDQDVADSAEIMAEVEALGKRFLDLHAEVRELVADAHAESQEIESRVRAIGNRSRAYGKLLTDTMVTPGVGLIVVGICSVFAPSSTAIATVGIVAGIAIFLRCVVARRAGVPSGFAPILAGTAATGVGITAAGGRYTEPLAHICVVLGVLLLLTGFVLWRMELRRLDQRLAAM
ncbi:hypothetical protein ABZ552_14975 [Nocardia sp. NPDC019219]|uniref:hypothetical protein n=1 Tax=Nocardia sp. NPDC019219 TaxID=3154590 RepID=UPI0033C5E8D2